MDSLISIRKSAARFMSGTLLSRATGFLRDLSLAYCFGASVELAALLLAFRLAHLFRRFFGEGALQSAFIPQYVTGGKRLYSELTTFLMITLTLVIVTGMTILNFFTSEVAIYTQLMLPSLFFICLYGLNLGLLQAEKTYFVPSAAPVLFNCTWIAAAWTVTSMREMALAINLACFLQWCATLPQALPHFEWRLPSRFLAVLWKPFALGLAGVAAAQINSAVDPFFAYYTDPSGPAYLWYAIRLQQLPLALIGLALSGALLPPLSRAAKEEREEDFKKFFSHGIKLTLLAAIPSTLFLYFGAHKIIQLIYAYGHFTATAATARCLSAYALGLVPAAINLILAPTYFARGNYRSPAIASALAVTTNLLLNTLLIFVWNQGPESVAFATSAASALQMAYLIKWRSVKIEV